MIGALMALAVSLAGQSDPEMTINPVPGKGFAITIATFPLEEGKAVQARMIAAAEQRCGKLTVRWGKFNYETQFGKDADSARAYAANYRQAFGCIDPATDPYKAVPADWKATPADDADALAFVKRYLAAFDAVDPAKALPMMEPLLEMDKATWIDQPLALKAARGTGSRTYSAPAWQANPSGAGHPGAYATVTFNGQYSGLAAYCGLLTIYRAGPGSYLVSQQNIRAIGKDEGASAETIAAACEGY